MGIVDKIQDKLSGNKHNEHDTTTTGTHVGQEPVGAHSGTHTGSHTGTGLTGNPNTTTSGLTGDRHSTGSGIAGTHNTTTGSRLTGSHNTPGTGLTGSHNTPGSGLTGGHHNTGITGGTAVSDEHTYSHPGHPQHADFVPGSHRSAQNPAAVPTAGGARVGSIPGGNGPYDDHHGTHGTQDNRSGMEKIKDKVVPSRADRPDDPITGQNYNQNTASGVSGHHNQSGLTGSHGTSAATPLAHDSSFNDRHTGSGLTGNTHSGTGLTGNTHSGTGLTGNTHSGTGLTGNTHSGTGLTGNTHSGPGLTGAGSAGPGIAGNTHSGSGLTGNTHSSQGLTGVGHTGDSHVPGTTHSGQGSHLAGNQTHGSGVGGTGVGGVGHTGTGAYDNTPGSGLGGHSTTHGTTTTISTHTNTTAGKPSLMDKLNPKKDADRDGKTGIMD
ncbi:hypothetical protein CLAFUW4_03266 [Fulvia fulva]|uniref:Uncharacterized protein n=1 Tax=Passalora fulva TaxID=5499 RepID=A0A9Q8L9W0_PASFU|nr:uncharacterized protein CLAFUR5_03248 [Fulvia fulva]KAK4632262.1 hypothetical protein CLAFUR4_03255 [Fulvia fulva]KAK4633376.1 hypothetical protein CLAFUR0_03259 [Fulvia fulva]UJO13467.1 hypothetical protein CLAFUR5_03248 [Fulvia fulva]WPV11151.1 hypothetical protein CLAFUW4_03266 [Fulvia fulva]WPV26372.1 hypothetical protein CLAFUW7_03259 [Fulvia fulva]